MGIEPTCLPWKGSILADVLYLHFILAISNQEVANLSRFSLRKLKDALFLTPMLKTRSTFNLQVV